MRAVVTLDDKVEMDMEMWMKQRRLSMNKTCWQVRLLNSVGSAGNKLWVYEALSNTVLTIVSVQVCFACRRLPVSVDENDPLQK